MELERLRLAQAQAVSDLERERARYAASREHDGRVLAVTGVRWRGMPRRIARRAAEFSATDPQSRPSDRTQKPADVAR